MANPETTTPSVEGDRLERAVQSEIQQWTATQFPKGCRVGSAAWVNGLTRRIVAALPCKGGEALEAYDAGLLNDYGGGDVSWWQDYLRSELARAHDFYADQFAATPTTEADTGRGLREAAEGALATMRRVADDVLSDQANDPTGTMWITVTRSCRELAVALAALSDTPRGREGEGKQGLMASRDLGPTTVASSLKGSDVGEVKP